MVDALQTKFRQANTRKFGGNVPKGSDHEWDTSPGKRTNSSQGCPFCNGQKPSVTNSLASLYPKLAQEWHPTKNENLTPDQVTKHSGKKVWWQCSNYPEHEWDVSPANRTKGKKCPFCAGQSITNSLANITL
ncbi:zinc-ribbon domain-containing protein [Microcoleus vaginatus]|uniref:zinc-ribbon domain-containing protein n=1 Tax=Microcoleus vaginatus TaxID=119532 RepID=UPI00403F5EB4